MAQEINNRRVLAIAVPIVLSNITVPILGAVDTAVIGQLGKAAPVAAVGVGAIIITCLLYTSPSPRDRVRSRMPSSA